MYYNIKFKKTIPNAIMPSKAHLDDAGYDLYAIFEKDDITVMPGETIIIDTGIAMQIPTGYVGLVYDRSSMGIKRHLSLPNSVGVIDSGYRDSIKVALQNNGSDPQVIQNKERIAQLVITPFLMETMLFEVEELDNSTRGAGGIGSSGRL